LAKEPDKNLPVAKDADVLAGLTPRNQLFLWGLLNGKKVVTAYEDAGYEGDTHAAYVLKARLDKELAALAMARGVSHGDLLSELGRLNTIPLQVPVDGVTVNQKLRILQLQDKVLERMKPDKPNITFLQINRFEEKPAEAPRMGENAAVIDAEIIPPTQEAAPQKDSAE
jgi:hypothetical protein